MYRLFGIRRKPVLIPRQFLFPRLWFGASIFSSRLSDPSHALACWCTNCFAPGYLCCGYPQKGNGDFDKAEKMITDNRVLFHRVANTLNYLDIKTVVVSCGTCYDQLAGYQFEQIFPGCRIIDIHEYLLEKGIKLGCEWRALYVSRSLPHPDEVTGSTKNSQ